MPVEYQFSTSEIQKKIEKGINEMPAMSPAVTKIIELANKSDALPRDLLSVIKLDPVMTGKILKLINSVLFALPQKVNIIDQAIILLGMNTIKNLALTTAVSGMFQRKKSGGSTQKMDELWHHSLGCAIAAKAMAKLAGVPRSQVEEYFTAGLLHDIGKLILVQSVAEDYEIIVKDANMRGMQAVLLEEECFDISHEIIGHTLGEKWNLKQDLLETIRHHHNPNIDQISTMTMIIYASNYYCMKHKIGFCDNVGNTTIDDKIWGLLKINEEQVIDIFDDLPIKLAEAKQMIN